MDSTPSSPCSSPRIHTDSGVASLKKRNAAAFAKELECPLCLSTFVSPRVLKCQHCFCLKCLYSHWSSASQLFSPNDRLWHTVLCPLKCEEKTTVVGGLEQLPHNYIITKLSNSIRKDEIERFKKDGKVSSDVGLSCEWCSSTTRVAPCDLCLSFVCATCMSTRSTLHHHLCAASLDQQHAGSDEKAIQKKTSEVEAALHGVHVGQTTEAAADVNGTEQENHNWKAPKFFSQEDALDRLFLELQQSKYHKRGSNGVISAPKVLSIRCSNHPFRQYSVVIRNLPSAKIYRFHLYRSQTFNTPITTNAYWLNPISSRSKCIDRCCSSNTSFPSIPLRLCAFLRSMVRQASKNLSVFVEALLHCAKELVPSVLKPNSNAGAAQKRIVVAPAGYQAFAYHVLWQAHHHLFIVYHMLYPLISRIQYSILFLVEPLLRSDSSADPSRFSFSSIDDSGNHNRSDHLRNHHRLSSGVEEESMDVFTMGNFHRTWSSQMELLHGALGELAEVIEHVEDACSEVKNLMMSNYNLCYQEDPRGAGKFSVELPNISLRHFLNTEKKVVERLNKSTLSLLKSIAALRDVSSRIAADSLKQLLGIRGRSQEAEAIAQLDHDLQSLQLQILYLCWGNHRMHYAILSGIIGRSIMEERSFPFLSSMVVLLESCYHSPPSPYEPLNKNLLSCIRDYVDSSALRGIWLLLPSLKEDLQQQHIDGQLAIHHNCQVTCYCTVMLDRLDIYCVIQPSQPLPATSDCFTANPRDSVELMRVVGSLPYEAFRSEERMPSALWLNGLDAFLACFLRSDVCFTLLYYFQDRGGIPQTSIFGRMGKSTSSLDTTFPYVDNVSELLSSSLFQQAGQKHKTRSGSTFDDERYLQYSLVDFLTFIEEDIKNMDKNTDAESTAAKDSAEERKTSCFNSGDSLLEQSVSLRGEDKEEVTVELRKCVEQVQKVAFPNWWVLHTKKREPLPWDIEASRIIQVPVYHIYFSVNQNDVMQLMFNAHTGSYTISACREEEKRKKRLSGFLSWLK